MADITIMSLAISKIFRERKEELVLAILALVVVLPVLYNRLPAYLPSPDILYVKAKVMMGLQGGIFADPVTGYDTMHPPWYYLFLSLFTAGGFDIDLVLVVVTAINIALLLFFTFKLIETVFDRTTGFYTALMIPFIIESMGGRNILLATSFYFSLPFYLAGLWLYFKSESSLRLSVVAAVLWGLAFIISPVYIFLIGLTFLYELLIKRRYRRFPVMAGAFIVTIIPFLVQTIYIYSEGLWGSRVFALWRGFPELEWWGHLITGFISPTINDPISIPAALHLLILIAALVLILKAKKVHWFVPLSLLAYFLTFYHFSDQYAIRIQAIFSVFIVAAVVSGVRSLRTSGIIWIIPILALAMFALTRHYSKTVVDYFSECKMYSEYRQAGAALWENMDKHLEPDRFIFCGEDIYLRYVMPHFPARSLAAYRKMDYFQLKAELSDELYRDYATALMSTDYAVIDSIAGKYHINTAVISRPETGIPLFKTLAQQWPQVYSDKYFIILKKPVG